MAAPFRVNVDQDRRNFGDAHRSGDDCADPYGEVHAIDPRDIASAEYSFTDAGLLLSRHSNASPAFLTLPLLLPILLLVALLALLLPVLLLIATLLTLLLLVLLLVALLALLLPVLLLIPTLLTLLLPILLLVPLLALLLSALLLIATLLALLLPVLISLSVAIFPRSLSGCGIALRTILLGTALSLLGLVALSLLGLLALALPIGLRAVTAFAL